MTDVLLLTEAEVLWNTLVVPYTAQLEEYFAVGGLTCIFARTMKWPLLHEHDHEDKPFIHPITRKSTTLCLGIRTREVEYEAEEQYGTDYNGKPRMHVVIRKKREPVQCENFYQGGEPITVLGYILYAVTWPLIWLSIITTVVVRLWRLAEISGRISATLKFLFFSRF